HGPVFTVPEPYIPKLGARVMSLQDPTAKMSKSDANNNAYISLLDDPDLVAKKIKRAVTDSGSTIAWEPDKRPGIANLMCIHSAITGQSVKDIETAYEGKGYGAFKSDLAEITVNFIRPVQERYRAVYDDRQGLARILRQGAEKAQARSQKTLDKVSDALGFVPR
ncbi:MAG: tryptophan--tRNA ligase, partial [Nevskiales bacterium]